MRFCRTHLHSELRALSIQLITEVHPAVKLDQGTLELLHQLTRIVDGYFASRQLALRARGRCLVSLLHAGKALLFFRKGLQALLCELLNLRTLLVTTFPILRKTYSECF